MARWYAFVVVPMSLAALIGSACDVPIQSTAGSGTVKTETRQVSGFSSVELNGSGTLNIRQTGTESLTIESDDNVLPKAGASSGRGCRHRPTAHGLTVHRAPFIVP